MVNTNLLLQVVTYMKHIGYNALFTQLIAKACVVQWIECRPPDSGADGSNHGVGRYFFLFIEKFTEYFQTFIYILAKLSSCILYLVRKMHAYPSLVYYLVHIQSGCIMISFGLI